MLSPKNKVFGLIVLMGCLFIIAACGSDSGNDEATTDNGHEDVSETADQASDETADETDNGEDYAYAVWNGEELDFNSTSCGYQAGVGYRVTAFGDGYHLQAQYAVSEDSEDMLDPEFDFSEVFRLEIFFSAGPGSTIGEGEGYVSDGPLTNVTGDELSARGTASLVPDSSSRAEEINPDGGEIEFEMQCAP